MPRIKPAVLDNLDTSTAGVLAAVTEKMGSLPNIFTTFAHSPVTLNGYLQLSDTLSKGKLTAAQRELIAVAVAQENQCGYCLSAHAAIGKSVGLTEDDIAQAQQGKAVRPKDQAIINFAIQVMHAQGAVSDEALATILGVLNDEGCVLEIVSNVILNTMTNYLNRLAGTQIDFPIMELDVCA